MLIWLPIPLVASRSEQHMLLVLLGSSAIKAIQTLKSSPNYVQVLKV